MYTRIRKLPLSVVWLHLWVLFAGLPASRLHSLQNPNQTGNVSQRLDRDATRHEQVRPQPQKNRTRDYKEMIARVLIVYCCCSLLLTFWGSVLPFSTSAFQISIVNKMSALFSQRYHHNRPLPFWRPEEEFSQWQVWLQGIASLNPIFELISRMLRDLCL